MQPEYFYGEFLRWSFGFENPNKAAALFACLVPMFFALVFASLLARRGWVRWAGSVVSVLGFLASAACLALTVSRGGLVAAGCGVLYVAGVYGIAVLRRRAQPCWRGVILGVALLLVAAVPVIWSGLGARSVEVEGDASVGNRLVLWKTGLHMAVDRPAGVGAGRSGAEYMQWYQPVEMTAGYRTMVNSPLTVLVEFGFGWFYVGIFLAAALWIGTRLRNKAPAGEGWMAVAARSSLIAFLVAGFFSTTWEEWMLWIPVVILGIACIGLAMRYGRAVPFRSVVPYAALVAVAAAAIPLAAGYFIAVSDPMMRQFGPLDEVTVSQRGSEGDPIGFIPDSDVLGDDYGKRAREIAAAVDRPVLTGRSSGDMPVLLIAAGAGVQKVLDSAIRTDTLLLMAPAVMDSVRADALLQSAKQAVVLIPGIDEDGRSLFWEEAAEDVAHVTLHTLDGVGTRVDWAWEDLLEIAESLFGKTPPQPETAATPTSVLNPRGLATTQRIEPQPSEARQPALLSSLPAGKFRINTDSIRQVSNSAIENRKSKFENYLWDGLALLMRDGTVYVTEPHPSGGIPVASYPVGKPHEITWHLNDLLGTTLATIQGTEVEFTRLTAFGAPLMAFEISAPSLDTSTDLAPRAPPVQQQPPTNNTP